MIKTVNLDQSLLQAKHNSEVNPNYFPRKFDLLHGHDDAEFYTERTVENRTGGCLNSGDRKSAVAEEMQIKSDQDGRRLARG